VLPLLQHETVATGWVSSNDFLAGYGAAQAVPGPLFTFAAFLGWIMAGTPGHGWGALLATAGIFLPACCWSFQRCPTGKRFARIRRWPQRSRVSMPRSSGCWRPRCTRPSGRVPFIRGPISRSPRLASFYWHAGECHRSLPYYFAQ